MKLLKKYFGMWAVVIVFLLPLVSLSQPGGGGGSGNSNPPKIDNPIKYDDLGLLLLKIAEEAAKIGFYVVVFFIIWSGFLFVSAQGNKTKLETARKTFLYTVIGAAILLGAVVLANVIEGTIDQLARIECRQHCSV